MSDTLSAAAILPPLSDTVPRVTGTFERIPKWLNLVPMVIQWLWLSLLYRSLTLPSAANPLINSGGMVGDGKLEYFRSMGPIAKAATADHIAVKSGENITSIAERMRMAGLSFPIVAKPDIGWCGY